MSAAREEVLARIRSALADVPAGEPADASTVAHGYAIASDVAADGLAARFAERAAEYRATVRRVEPDAIAAAVGDALAAHDARRVAVPSGLPGGWRPRGIELVEDSPSLSPADLDAFDGALTGCALAIAETGTIVLDAGPDQGRRALSLVPDLHVCVVDARWIVGSVPQAIRALEGAAGGEGRPITLVSGPSATSDIELDRVEGVHGPRRLEIVVAG